MLQMRKPKWLRAALPGGKGCREVREIIAGGRLHTVCQSARCPNVGECWARRTATFMILGDVCTRHCAFCAVSHGIPRPPDFSEPERVAQAVLKMSLRHAVITSVTRDDLPDSGAAFWAETIQAVKKHNPATTIEVLVPDFSGKAELLDIVLDANPDILNHNLETVEQLQKTIRQKANYTDSLRILRHAKERGFAAKSGLLLGLGENKEKVAQTLRDLREAGVDIVTLGQYLQPTPQNIPVARWVTPEEFAEWKAFALSIGFHSAESGPLVRSSYHAEEHASTLQHVCDD